MYPRIGNKKLILTDVPKAINEALDSVGAMTNRWAWNEAILLANRLYMVDTASLVSWILEDPYTPTLSGWTPKKRPDGTYMLHSTTPYQLEGTVDLQDDLRIKIMQALDYEAEFQGSEVKHDEQVELESRLAKMKMEDAEIERMAASLLDKLTSQTN